MPREIGRELPPESNEGHIPSNDYVACVMYTFGTTGSSPRVFSSTNLIVTIGASAVDTLVGFHLTPDDIFLAFFPLAHILAYVFELHQ